MSIMVDIDVLGQRLRATGLAVDTVFPAAGGVVATAGLATLADGSSVFAKTLPGPDSDLFDVEAEGLRAMRERSGANTAEVIAATGNLLVLAPLRARLDDEQFWERLAHMMVTLHSSTVNDRFGWHRDGWLGRMRQDNTWDTDGHAFFADRRVLRWLPEPLVERALGAEDRRSLERLCAALPDLVPDRPPVLTHGDLWSNNVLADQTGAPVLIDPAVSYTWAEVDLSMLWQSPRAPQSQRFFDVYAETAGLADGWVDRMPLLWLRELLSVIAHGDDDWGAADEVRRIIAPFRQR
jgi:fructosamine-3-kinase